jgi:NADH:ubiquinone oxidoreductase subunit 5 (subunit L)/multisubunit Na+/H+ antiporter MnhA subunit
VFKGLLFFGAGAILHGAHTRQLDRLGGLLKHMPIAGALILIGAAAGAGLPGLAAFASEWPLYLAGLSTGSWTGVIVVITLALCGGAALAAYTKFYGTVFLGAARTTASAQAHEPKASMLSPMAILAVLSVLLALALPLTLQVIKPAISQTLGTPTQELAPLISLSPYLLSLSTLALLVFGTLLFLALKSHLKKAPLSRSVTWDCGYADPQASMQYTARSFTRVLGDELTPEPIKPQSDISPAQGLFPTLAKLSVKAGDGVLDRIFVPLANRVAEFFQKLRLFQQGHLAMYLLYILITTAVLLAVALVGG